MVQWSLDKTRLHGPLTLPRQMQDQDFFLKLLEVLRYNRVRKLTMQSLQQICNKSEASESVLSFVMWFAPQCERLVVSLHTYAGLTFSASKRTLKEKAPILHSVVHTEIEWIGRTESRYNFNSNSSKLTPVEPTNTFSNYASLHAIYCENILPNSCTAKLSYEVVHGHQSTELNYILRFGCRVLYHPVTNPLPTFSTLASTKVYI